MIPRAGTSPLPVKHPYKTYLVKPIFKMIAYTVPYKTPLHPYLYNLFVYYKGLLVLCLSMHYSTLSNYNLSFILFCGGVVVFSLFFRFPAIFKNNKIKNPAKILLSTGLLL